MIAHPCLRASDFCSKTSLRGGCGVLEREPSHDSDRLGKLSFELPVAPESRPGGESARAKEPPRSKVSEREQSADGQCLANGRNTKKKGNSQGLDLSAPSSSLLPPRSEGHRGPSALFANKALERDPRPRARVDNQPVALPFATQQRAHPDMVLRQEPGLSPKPTGSAPTA